MRDGGERTEVMQLGRLKKGIKIYPKGANLTNGMSKWYKGLGLIKLCLLGGEPLAGSLL